MSQAITNRRVLAAALGAVLIIGAVALAGPLRAASAVKPGTLTVSLKTPVSQQKLLTTGKIRARVGLGFVGSVKVVAGVLPENARSAKPITKTRVLRFRRLGSKKAVLRLKARGRSLLADCSSKSLVVAARPIALAHSASNGVARAKTAIQIDSPACGGGGGSPASGGTGWAGP